MNIIELDIQGFRKIRALRINKMESTVILQGKNGSGKTSVLDAIWTLMRTLEVIDAVNSAMDKSKLRMVIGQNGVPAYEVTKSVTGSEISAIKVKDLRNGSSMDSPQTFLKGLLSVLARNPLLFLQKSKAEQYEVLRRVMGLDFDEFDNGKQELEAQRLTVGRTGKALAEQLQQLGTAEEFASVPDTPIDVADVMRQIDEQNKKAAEVEEYNRRIAGIERDIALAQDAWQKHRDTAQDLYDKYKLEMERVEKTLAHLEVLKKSACDFTFGKPIGADPEKVAALKEQINKASEINNKINKKKMFSDLNAKVTAERKLYKQLTDKIQAIEDSKGKLLAAAKPPVEGLSLNPDTKQVLYKGRPMEASSTAEKIRISVEMAIAEDPKLKVLLIEDGSLLDSETMKIISDTAEAKGFQIFVEKVADTNKGIEDYFEIIGADATTEIPEEPAKKASKSSKTKEKASKEEAEDELAF